MRYYKVHISLRELLYIIGAVLLIFEIYLMDYINVFRYVDEIVTVLCLAKILSAAFRKGLDRYHIYMLLLMVLLLGIGLVSNYFTNLQENWKPIVTDIGNTFKVFITYIGSSLYLKPVKDKSRIVRLLAKVIRLFVLVLFGFMVLHLTGIYKMGNDIRYGLPSFEFINFGAGQLSLMFYFIFLILTADLRYDKRKRQIKVLYLVMAAIVWVSTLRTRAFMYVAMYFVLYWLLVVKNYQIKLNWKTILIVLVAFIILSADQVEVYFTNKKSARYYFMFFGFYTMKQYFPFGAGFSTYGTDAAVVYYAKLYYRYGFPSVWGLNPEYPLFAHDNYWPAIMAQFGFFGVIVMGLILICWVRDVLSRTRYNKYVYLAGLFICLTQLSASIATATFFHFVTVGIFFLLPLLFDDSDSTTESRALHETSNRLHPHIQPL